jgi:hypothetical protein
MKAQEPPSSFVRCSAFDVRGSAFVFAAEDERRTSNAEHRTSNDLVPSLRAKACCCAAMCALFLITYGGCLHITAARAPVPSLAFAWERHTPFMPALIVPYMSIDLFFVGSFFLCTRRGELRTHVKRLALAMVVATACFLLFPLQMAYARSPVDGIWAFWFTSLHAFDQPYNLAPSLHIALWTILLAAYGRHTRGWLRAAIASWFALIYVSTVFTWQHQVFDVITGQALGLLALYLFRERERPPHEHPAAATTD